MKFYLIGIKGSGMSALACLLKDDGHIVTGSDIANYVYTEDNLNKKGIKVQPLEDEGYKEGFFVVVGHAFMNQERQKELCLAKVPYLEYNQFLTLYLHDVNLISICGSHGKTTLTGLLASGSNLGSYLRGDGYAKRSSDERYFFLESCEYQDHFLVYYPQFIIVTNVDYDHVDYFKSVEDYVRSFQQFVDKSPKGLIDFDSAIVLHAPQYLTYGLNPKADFNCTDYAVDHRGIRGKMFYRDKFLIDFSFPNMFGEPLLKDVVATLAFYYLQGNDLQAVVENLQEFTMAEKRFNTKKLRNDNIIINDYAHHPTQIKANLDTLKKSYPHYRYIAFFKPDRMSRLTYFFKEFSAILNQFDEAYLVDKADHEFATELQKMTSAKIVFLDDGLQPNFDAKYKYVFCCMSSKDMNDIIKMLTDK